MRYTEEEIKRQLDLAEDSAWEFKQVELAGRRLKSPGRDDLADEIAAFANSRGGVLLCGVTDDGEAQGLSRGEIVSLDSAIVEISTDAIKPAVRIQTFHVGFEGSRLLIVDVPEGDQQYDSPGGCYMRVGASKRRISTEERNRLAQRRGQARFRSYDESVLQDTGLSTLNQLLWKPLLSAEGARDPVSALRKLALVTYDQSGIIRATVAGILLCTHSPERWIPSARITATYYRGSDRASRQIDAQEITGPLDRQIADALRFAIRNMRIAARKDPARVDLPQYSEKALFEALVNAVAHRDYSIKGSKVRLSMFQDRLEIHSPGSLPNNLTIESMVERQSTRNEVLTSVLGRMPVKGAPGSQDRLYFMESRGDGVSIIRRETMALTGLLPEYRLIDGSELCLTIPSANQEPSAARTLILVRSDGKPLADTDVLVLYPNRTWKRSTTDEYGEATFNLHTTTLPMRVFVAAAGYAAHVERGWIPSNRALAVSLGRQPDGGSVIFPEGAGHLSGLRGRLNAILDSHNRGYLYASNIAINQGLQQPVQFTFGEELRLTDTDGVERSVRIVDQLGSAALIEYGPFPSE
ncbi:MAG: putative DNA binding domain-containing protein [Bacteroidota bacterium]|nr:putative DNA binding domain-containing protein [Bacteroidota bacterium]